MARDVSPLTKMTLGSNNELTPIPKVPGTLNNVIYTSSSVASSHHHHHHHNSHIPYSAIPMPRSGDGGGGGGGLGLDDSSVMTSATPSRSSTSSMFQVHVDPKQQHNYGNSLQDPNQQFHQQLLQLPHQPVHSPVYSQANGRHNPFTPVSPHNNNTNILMSSANLYPE